MVVIINPNLENLTRYLMDSIDQLQYSRENALNYFQGIQATSNSLLQAELKILTDKFGKDDPTVIRLSSLIQQNTNIINELQSELKNGKAQSTVVAPDQTQVHGRATNKNLQGIDNLTVSMVNEKGKSIGINTTTDSSGYYSILIDDSTRQKILKGSRKLFLNVRNKNNALVYKSQHPLEIKSGTLLNDITITEF